MKKIVAISVISSLWLIVLAIGVALTLLFDQFDIPGEFVIRVILISPFSMSAVYLTPEIWNHFNPKIF